MIAWVKPVMDFAKMVLPDLLAHLGEEHADQAFVELQKLYEKYKDDPAGARQVIPEIKLKVAKGRASRAAERQAKRAARDAETPDSDED